MRSKIRTEFRGRTDRVLSVPWGHRTCNWNIHGPLQQPRTYSTVTGLQNFRKDDLLAFLLKEFPYNQYNNPSYSAHPDSYYRSCSDIRYFYKPCINTRLMIVLRYQNCDLPNTMFTFWFWHATTAINTAATRSKGIPLIRILSWSLWRRCWISGRRYWAIWAGSAFVIYGAILTQ